MASDAYQEGVEYRTIYKCAACDEQHDTKAEAKNCCPTEKAFLCEECEEEFSSAALAKGCCSRWVCEYCGTDFDTKKEAKKCCKDEEE